MGSSTKMKVCVLAWLAVDDGIVPMSWFPCAAAVGEPLEKLATSLRGLLEDPAALRALLGCGALSAAIGILTFSHPPSWFSSGVRSAYCGSSGSERSAPTGRSAGGEPAPLAQKRGA